LKRAEAKTASDWIDIFQEVIEHAVRTTMEENGDGKNVLEKLEPSRTAFRAIKARFNDHGLPLLDALEVEGPLVVSNRLGYDDVTWPLGEWVRFYWPGRTDHLEFRGHQALVAMAFIMWWSQFQRTAQQWSDQLAGKEEKQGRTRAIEPGSPEWNQYFAMKNADLRRQGLIT
jgi:hypothetical protein